MSCRCLWDSRTFDCTTSPEQLTMYAIEMFSRNCLPKVAKVVALQFGIFAQKTWRNGPRRQTVAWKMKCWSSFSWTHEELVTTAARVAQNDAIIILLTLFFAPTNVSFLFHARCLLSDQTSRQRTCKFTQHYVANSNHFPVCWLWRHRSQYLLWPGHRSNDWTDGKWSRLSQRNAVTAIYQCVVRQSTLLQLHLLIRLSIFNNLLIDSKWCLMVTPSLRNCNSERITLPNWLFDQ